MANSGEPNVDEKSSATFVTELIPVHTKTKLKATGFESWCCAFSPDESYFAWSAVPFKPGIGILVDSKHQAEDCFGCHAISINTGHIVRSMAFGASNMIYSSSPPFWHRFSSCKDLVLSTGHINGRIRTWDVLTGKLVLELLDHRDMISCMVFSPVNNLVLVSASYDGTLKVWDLQEDGNLFRTLTMNHKPIYSCAWSPDAKALVSVGMCKMIYVWDMKTLQVKLKLQGHHHDVVSCAFSPDGCLIASASWDTRVILWNSHSGQQLKSFNHLLPPPLLIFACGCNGTWIRDVSFSSDGAHLTTVADDGYLRIWDISSKDENPEAMVAVENALCCSYTPSGNTIAVGSKHGSATFWNAPACIKSLLYMSRLRLRKMVSAENVHRLAIPKRLVEYLLYKELE